MNRRILEMQLLDVYAHVHYHKVKTKNRLEAAAVPDSNGRYNKAMLFLDRWPAVCFFFFGFGDFDFDMCFLHIYIIYILYIYMIYIYCIYYTHV